MSRKSPFEKRQFKNLVHHHEEFSLEGEKELIAESKYAEYFVWGVAEEYTEDPYTISVKSVGDRKRYSPMLEPDLFLSFVRLGSKEYITDEAIRRWVGKYGLLRLKDLDSSKDIQQRKDTKKPLPRNPEDHASEYLHSIREKVLEAHSADLLYRDLNQMDIPSLERRATELHSTESLERDLTELEKLTIRHWSESSKQSMPETTRLWMTTMGFEEFMRKKLSGVQTSLSFDKLPLARYPAYAPRRSHKCPDLISAIYLWFYLRITEARPMICCSNPNCGTPFPRRRKDHKYCCDGCRSSGRPSRRKGEGNESET